MPERRRAKANLGGRVRVAGRTTILEDAVMRWMTTMALLGLVLMAGCGGGNEKPEATPEAPTPRLHGCFNNRCEKEIYATEGFSALDGEGEVVFCSVGCRDLFELDPDFYRPK